MTTKKTKATTEATTTVDMSGMTLTALLNFDVDTSVELEKASNPINDTILAVAQLIEPTEAAVQKYVDEWASACKAKGMHPSSIKGLKSNRKCVLEFACGLRDGQEDKEIWSYENCQTMVKQLRENASDIHNYAKLCREAIKDEQPEQEEEFDFKKKFEKLYQKAIEFGYENEEIEFAIKLIMNPEAALDAAA